MIYDANFGHEPLGHSGAAIFHRSCAEQAGRSDDWEAYTVVTTGGARCYWCITHGRHVPCLLVYTVPPPPPTEAEHFI